MQRRPLGRTGLKVTGTSSGTSWAACPTPTATRTMRGGRATVWAILGGPPNLLDTSNSYGFGRSEARVGAVIREPRPRPRHGGKPRAAWPRPGAEVLHLHDPDAQGHRLEAPGVRRQVAERPLTVGRPTAAPPLTPVPATGRGGRPRG